MDKNITIEELEEIVADLREQNKSIVTTNGAFDLFHAGHVRSLEFAKQQGDVLFVALNSDNSIKKYKSEKRPIIPQEERQEIVASVGVVDYVLIFEERDPRKIIGIIQPNIHVKGSEYEKEIVERETVEKYGGKIVFLERKGPSTSAIIERVVKRYG